MIRAISVLAVGVIALSCSAVRIGPIGSGPDHVSARLQSATNTADSTFLREMSEFIRIVDPGYWRDSLRHTPNLIAFRAGIENYFAMRDFATRPDTPERNEWREEMYKRIGYGREHFGSTLYATMRDVRWELVLQLGIPSFTQRVRDPDSDIDIEILTWDNEGLEIVCESLRGGGYPVWMRPSMQKPGEMIDPLVGSRLDYVTQRHAARAAQVPALISLAKKLGDLTRFAAFPGLDRIIRSNIAPIVFPNDDGTSDLWLATLTRGDQFSDSTLRGDRFDLELVVYDHAKRVVGRDSCSLGGLKRLVEIADRKAIGISGYLGCPRLAPGRYDFVLSLRGSGDDNVGVYRDTLTVPSHRSLRGTSDIILTFSPDAAVSGDAIMRKGIPLYANPHPVFHRGDTVYAYVEFPEGEIAGNVYRVTVSLIPQVDAYFTWRPGLRHEVALFSTEFKKGELRGVFRRAIGLSGVDTGHYFLSIQIAAQLQDPIGEDPVMAWTEIELK